MRGSLGRLIAVALAAAGCGRTGFDEHVPGLGDVDGIRVSGPGALVPEENRYDIAAAIDGPGYAVAWVEYPEVDRTPRLMFTIVSDQGETVVAPRAVEILADAPRVVRLWAGATGYLLVVAGASGGVFTALDRAGIGTARREDTSSVFNEVTGTASAGGFTIAYNEVSVITTEALDASGALLAGPTQVEPAALATQINPTIAGSGGPIGLAWVDERTGSPRIRYVPLDASGVATKPSIQIHEDGQDQGRPYLASAGAAGFLLAHDGFSTLPQRLIRIGVDGTPVWPAPAVIYDEPRYHDTLDMAASAEGRGGFVWITETETLLTNIEITTVDTDLAAAPVVPPAAVVTDPRYSFCYPDIARGTASFGSVFAGEVEGSLALFLVIVPD